MQDRHFAPEPSQSPMPSKSPPTIRRSAANGTAKRSRGRPRLEDVAAIDDELLSVALSEFIEHGYGGASMTRIARVAEMSKATLYARYSSKEDLFRAIMHRQINGIQPESLLSTQSGLSGLEEGLRAYANRMLQLSFEGDMLAINRLIYSESHRFPELAAAATERTGQGIKRIAEFISERGHLDGIPCRDPEIVAEIFIYMIRGWYVSKMLDNSDISPSQRGKWVKRAVAAVIASRENW